MSQPTIESILQENRLFPPSAEFSAKATIKSLNEYNAIYARAAADPVAFWEDLAKTELHWFKPWTQGLDWSHPPLAMLACARIGAVHGVVFGGFSAEALRDRLVDAAVKVVITADGGWRKDAVVNTHP